MEYLHKDPFRNSFNNLEILTETGGFKKQERLDHF